MRGRDLWRGWHSAGYVRSVGKAAIWTATALLMLAGVLAVAVGAGSLVRVLGWATW